MEQFYSASAELGKLQSMKGLVISAIISIILIIISIYYFTHPNTNLIPTVGKVIDVKCNPIIINKTQTNSCNLTIAFEIGQQGKNLLTYKSILTTNNNKIYNIGELIAISYDPQNPSLIYEKSISTYIIASGLLAASILLFTGSYYTYYISSRSKLFAASEGVNIVGSTVFNGFR